MADVRAGLVSVVLVNFRGVDDTLEALDRLREIDWPEDRLEIVVVENGSGDDSASRLREVPGIKLVVSKENLGFAGGCNLGVAKSSGEVIGLLNNDARPDPQWIAAAMAVFDSAPEVGAVASRVLDWQGERVDYIDAAMTWYGMGYKPYTGDPVPRNEPPAHDVLFGTGSAMFVRRDVYLSLGGFDEDYFMFFEDVDLGWRLNLRGWSFRYEPASVAYHKHHASMKEFGQHKENYFLERNALATLYKNADSTFLSQALPAAMGLAVRRGVDRAKLDSTSFDLRRGGEDSRDVTLDRQAVVPLFAIDQFVEQLPNLVKKRAAVQASRTASEARIRRLLGDIDAPIIHTPSFQRGYEHLVEAFPMLETRDTRRIAIVTGDPLGRRLAGPAIRAWNMADLLARDADVVLVSLTGVEEGLTAPFELAHVAPGDDRRFSPIEAWADIIVFQGHAMAVFESIRSSQKILVVDAYDPMHLEQLEQARDLPASAWAQQVADATDVLNEQFERGDFFLCASERQRYLYLGQLASLGRLNPATYEDDPDLTGLIAVAPFGLSSTPPHHERDVLKGVLPGIGRDDKLLIWSGGIYNWFDPETLIRAVDAVSNRHPEVRLFFQGTKHPHPDVPEMAVIGRSRQLAEQLGAAGRTVFFNDSWIDYNDRQNYLLEADAGVSTHFSHVETTFSFRTRILDYLWAGLPMVVTAGDHFAELIERERLGVVVPAEDVGALAAALERVLYDEDFIAEARRNIARVREDYVWERALAPLLEFARDPHHAADFSGKPSGGRGKKRRRRSGLAHDIRRAAHYLRNGGPRVVLQKVQRRIGRGS